MKTFLLILLGLSLGSGLTLIVLQERFIRERRRLLSLGESQRAKASQASLAVLTKQWEQKYQLQGEDLQACQGQLAALAANPPQAPETPQAAIEDAIPRPLHEQLLGEKAAEIDRLTAERDELSQQASQQTIRQQEEITELQGQIERFTNEISQLKRQVELMTDNDFLLLGQPGGHMLPGSVVRAFIKGQHRSQGSPQPR